MKNYLLLIANLLCVSSLPALTCDEIKAFADNQYQVNEHYYYSTREKHMEWFYEGKMQAYKEVSEYIKRHIIESDNDFFIP